jgi:hypothetical protein
MPTQPSTDTEALNKSEPAPIGEGWASIPADHFGGVTKRGRQSTWYAWPSTEMAAQAAAWWSAQAGLANDGPQLKGCAPRDVGYTTPAPSLDRWDCERYSHAAMVCACILDGSGPWEAIPGDKHNGTRQVIDGEIARRWPTTDDALMAEADYIVQRDQATLADDAPGEPKGNNVRKVWYFDRISDDARYCAELLTPHEMMRLGGRIVIPTSELERQPFSGIRLVIPLSKAQQLSLFGAGGTVNPGKPSKSRKPVVGQQVGLFTSRESHPVGGERQWVHPHTRLTESGKVVQVEGHFREGPVAQAQPESSPVLHPLVELGARPKPRKPGERDIDPNHPIREVFRERTRAGGAAEAAHVGRMTDEERRRLGTAAAIPRITGEVMRLRRERQHVKPGQEGGEGFVAPQHEGEMLAPQPTRKPKGKQGQPGHEEGVEYHVNEPTETKPAEPAQAPVVDIKAKLKEIQAKIAAARFFPNRYPGRVTTVDRVTVQLGEGEGFVRKENGAWVLHTKAWSASQAGVSEEDLVAVGWKKSASAPSAPVTPTPPPPPKQDPPGLQHYSAWETRGGGSPAPGVGHVFRDVTDPKNPKYMVVHSVGQRRYIRDDALSFGGHTDEPGHLTHYTARPATDEEAAPLKAKHEAKAKSAEEAKTAAANETDRSSELELSYQQRPGYVHISDFGGEGVTDWKKVHEETTGFKRTYYEGTTPEGKPILRKDVLGGYDDPGRSAYWAPEEHAGYSAVKMAQRHGLTPEEAAENAASPYVSKKFYQHFVGPELARNPNAPHVREYHAALAEQKAKAQREIEAGEELKRHVEGGVVKSRAHAQEIVSITKRMGITMVPGGNAIASEARRILAGERSTFDPSKYAPTVQGKAIMTRLAGRGYDVTHAGEDHELGLSHFVVSKVPEGKVRKVEVARYRVNEAGGVEAESVHKKHGDQAVADINAAHSATKTDTKTLMTRATALMNDPRAERLDADIAARLSRKLQDGMAGRPGSDLEGAIRETEMAYASKSIDSERHAWLARFHRRLASDITSTDVESALRQTAHEHAASAHEAAARNPKNSEYAIGASRRANIDPFKVGR